jgi:hypothetical protein
MTFPAINPTSSASSTPSGADTRTDAEIEASINAKIREAIDAAVAAGDVDGDKKIGVLIGDDGTIQVGNVDEAPDTPTVSTPDEVELPAMFREDRESLTDSHYAKHLETHWGF